MPRKRGPSHSEGYWHSAAPQRLHPSRPGWRELTVLLQLPLIVQDGLELTTLPRTTLNLQCSCLHIWSVGIYRGAPSCLVVSELEPRALCYQLSHSPALPSTLYVPCSRNLTDAVLFPPRPPLLRQAPPLGYHCWLCPAPAEIRTLRPR